MGVGTQTTFAGVQTHSKNNIIVEKKPMYLRHLSHPRKITSLGAIALLLLCGSASLPVWADQLVNRSLSPQEIADFELPEGTQVSSGLFNVGLGVTINLEAQVASAAVVTGVAWELTSQPIDSVAVLEDSILGPEVPIFSQGDRAVYQVADRMLLLPDVVGLYLVTATVTTDVEDIVLTQWFTAAEYVGVGKLVSNGEDGMSIESAGPGQCAVCHADKAGDWIETNHAGALTRKIDGIGVGFFAEFCIECHSTGYNGAPTADNHGFDDVQDDTGWTFPETLEPGNWDLMPQELKNAANIQCESCHGPGGEHFSTAGDLTIFNPPSVSLSAGDCGQCHDALSHHIKVQEWEGSQHSIATRYPTGERRESCVRCHSGAGFVDFVDGTDKYGTIYEAITCSTCHDPHDATNPHQLRKIDDVTLMDGETVITKGGYGKLCMNCHISRRDADTYVLGTSGHFGPHLGPQTDMLVGANAIEYGKEIGSSGHINAVANGCPTCHMQATGEEDIIHLKAGGHTFKPSWDGGTPDDHSDDVDMTAACAVCHGEVEDFNFKQEDFNGDGFVEGIREEIEGMLHELAMQLPPIGEPTVSGNVQADTHTLAQKKAVYNYLFVEEDGSHGVHNLSYAVGILQASLEDLNRPGNFFGSTEIDGFPGWRASPWYGNYNVDFYPWIFHDDHGWQFVSETASSEASIFLYDLGLGQWLYFSSETYRWMFMFGPNEGWIWTFSDNPPGTRNFQRLDDGTLFTVPRN